MAWSGGGQGAIVVSGGTYGLGAEVCAALASDGYSVVAFGLPVPESLSGISEVMPIETMLAPEASGRERLEVIYADVTDEGEVTRVVRQAIREFGQIAGLVNNAAIGPLGTVLTTDVKTVDAILAVNVKGSMVTSRAVIPHMREAGGGSIVNVGSGSAYGKPNMAAYSASKGALLALSYSMAYDHFADHIRVNVVVPGGGGIVSGMSVLRVNGNVGSIKRRSAPGSVAGRQVNGRDLANVISFFLSDASSTITGSVLHVGCFANQGGPLPNNG